MARARTPEGKRVVIPVRVSEPTAAHLDQARGDIPRSVWVRAAIEAFLVTAMDAQGDTVPGLGDGRVPVYVNTEPEPIQVYAYTDTAEPELDTTPEPPRRACKHKHMTTTKGGRCRDCGEWVPATS